MSVARFFGWTAARFGRLDVLVNNAGYGNISSIEETSLADFREQIETNLFGVINVTKAAIPLMREQRSGHIIQISSVGGRLTPSGRGAYAAAKAGVGALSEVLAKEVGPLGIKVTIVEPGGFRTDFAGTSTTIHDSRSEYDSTVGAMARYQRDYNGKQPGDAANAAEKKDMARIEADRRWRDLSVSTDFHPDGGSEVHSWAQE